MFTKQPAFTLIELLVVITIIIVLLALLAPAMDKAIYQAELVVCATHQHAVAVSVIAYASSNQRRYPVHRNVELGGESNTVCAPTGAVGGSQGVNGSSNVVDDRPLMRQYLPRLNDVLVDPLAGKIDVDLASSGVVQTGMMMYWDYRYLSAGEKGTYRLGDRFTWQGSEFNILTADWDVLVPGPWRGTNHPDDRGLLTLLVLNDAPGVGPTQPDGPIYNYTIQEWRGVSGVADRGLLDRNFSYDDGSVRRYDHLIPGENDPRMVRVPFRAAVDGPTTYNDFLPGH